MRIGFDLKSPTALAPNQGVSLFFEALKPGIDFPFLAMKVLDGIYFQYKAISSTLKKIINYLVSFKKLFFSSLNVVNWCTSPSFWPFLAFNITITNLNHF